jgi:hypothetical protein
MVVMVVMWTLCSVVLVLAAAPILARQAGKTAVRGAV